MESAVAELPLQQPERANVPVPITPMQMLQIAVEQGADLDKLSKLMDLQERWEKNEARKAFVAALNAFKEKPPTILKDKSASFGQGKTAYTYARLDQVAAVIGKALSERGLSHRWETEQTEGKIRVTCVLTHALGHSERVSLEAGADTSGSKNAIQSIGSTVTYLERYTLLAITGLAASDQDDDGKKGTLGVISDEQKADLVELIKSTGADTKRLLDYYAIGSVDELPASLFADAKARLVQRNKQAAK